MKKQIGYLFVFITVFIWNNAFPQDSLKTDLSKVNSGIFSEDEILPIKLSYSINEIKKETNDSTYIDSNLSYQLSDGSWGSLPVELRARGNYRLKNCYFAPLKIKIKKSVSNHTPFEGNKTFKAVLPCLLNSDNDDNVIKEYLVYKLFEMVSPYYFKTRLFDVDFDQFSNVAEALLKLTPVIKSQLSGEYNHAFVRKIEGGYLAIIKTPALPLKSEDK